VNIELTIRELRHSSSIVRYEAAKRLGGIPASTDEAQIVIDPLIAALADSDSKVQYAAFSSLIKIGARRAVMPMIDTLINNLDSQLWALLKLNIGMRLRAGLIELVDRGDNDLSDHLHKILTTEDSTLDEHQRALFIRLLGKTGDPRRVDMLISILLRNNVSLQVAAAEALGMVGDKRAVPPLMLFVRESEDTFSDNAVREVAVEALGRLGDLVAFDPLISCLSDPNEWVRRAAAEALGRLGDARATEPLAQSLQDYSPMVQDAAFAAIKQLSASPLSQ